MVSPTSSELSSFKRAWPFLSDYFLHSNNKARAWALFAGGVLGVLAVTGLGFVLGWGCFPLIYAAVIAKDLGLLLVSIGAGLLTAAGMAGFHYLANFLKNKLYVDWRSWLTKKIINQYLNNPTNHLAISRVYKELDNPEQRIQEDVDKLVESTLTLTLGFIENALTLSVFSTFLGIAGGTLSFAILGTTILLPGYLVLVAFVVGGASSLIGFFINKSLSKLTNDETKTQSFLRADLQQLKNSSEEIAIERAEKYYKKRFEKTVDHLNEQTTKRLSNQNKSASFNLFNQIFQTLIPYLAAIPLYFKNLLTLDAFYACGFYFSMVTRSLNWFINSFQTINVFKTSLNRILELQKILNTTKEGSGFKKINRNIVHKSEYVKVDNLTLNLHSGNELVIKGLNVTFKPGVHTLIQAPSGTGKSSLFKAIAGTWISGEGEITIPHSLESIYFLPQKPTLPDDTLKNVLAYPDAECSFSDDELVTALKAVNLESFTNRLGEKIGFKSLGEQQRIAFARVLLRKPAWVFLDEATASLDEEGETHVYCRIKELLPKTTLVSIAHRSTVKRYHDDVLFFSANDKKEAQVQIKQLALSGRY